MPDRKRMGLEIQVKLLFPQPWWSQLPSKAMVFSLLEHQILLSVVIIYLIAAISFQSSKVKCFSTKKKNVPLGRIWGNIEFKELLPVLLMPEGRPVNSQLQTCTKLHKTCSPTFKKSWLSQHHSSRFALLHFNLWQLLLVLCCSSFFFSLTFLWLPVILTLELITQPYPTEFNCTVVCTSPLKQNHRHDNRAFSSGKKKKQKTEKNGFF